LELRASIEKMTGTLLGSAVGNALGAPASGKTLEEKNELFGTIDNYQDSFDLEKFAEESKGMDERDREFLISRWLPAGVYTDDIQQTLAVCDCLIADKDFLGESLASMFCRMASARVPGLRFGVYRGAGRSFRDSLRSLRDGEDWRLSGQDSASNGAAMRVAPLGSFFHNDLDRLKQAVIDQSVLTHREVMAIAAAQAVAHIVALALPLRKIDDPAGFLNEVLEHSRAGEELALKQDDGVVTNLDAHLHGFSEALTRIEAYLDLAIEEGMAKIGELAEERSEREGIGATGGYVLSSVITSIYVFLMKRGTYEQAVLTAVNLGGNTDTIGAMVGAMSGALHGVYSMPVRWTRQLANMEQIRIRGEALARNEGSPHSLRSLVQIEEQTGHIIAEELNKYLPESLPPSEGRRADGGGGRYGRSRRDGGRPREGDRGGRSDRDERGGRGDRRSRD